MKSTVHAKEQHLSILLTPLLNCTVDMVFSCHPHTYFQIHLIGLIPTLGLIVLQWSWSGHSQSHYLVVFPKQKKELYTFNKNKRERLSWLFPSHLFFQPRLFHPNHTPQQAPLVPHSYPMCSNCNPPGLCIRCTAVHLYSCRASGKPSGNFYMADSYYSLDISSFKES